MKNFIEVSRSDSWLHYSNTGIKGHSNYKLHVYLHNTEFEAFHGLVYSTLEKALEDEVIAGFKCLNIGDGDVITGALTHPEATFDEDKNSRLFNSPFTIYLPELIDYQKLEILCVEIEKTLNAAKPINRLNLSDADLDLLPHISFRQECLDGEYIAIFDADPFNLNKLREEGLNSGVYHSLKEQIEISWENQTSNEYVEKRERKDQASFINKTYDAYYMPVTNAFENGSNARKFKAACYLLNIDAKEWASMNDDPDELLRLANKKRNLFFLKTHSDKLNAYSDDIKEKASKLHLMGDAAKEILNCFCENPNLLENDEGILEQSFGDSKRYEYELADGYDNDPYYYIHMAKSTSYYPIKRNWEIVNEPVLLEGEQADGNSYALTLYEKKLVVYSSSSKKSVKKLPGYKAFYYLYISGALPRSFDRGHFSMAVNIDSNQWLLKKALTDPKLIVGIDSFQAMRLAMGCAERGMFDFLESPNPLDILRYYYRNHPQTLYKSRLETWIKNFFNEITRFKRPNKIAQQYNISPKDFFQVFIDEKENLHALSDRGLTYLARESDDIYEIVINDVELADKLKLSANKFHGINIIGDKDNLSGEMVSFVFEKILSKHFEILNYLNIAFLLCLKNEAAKTKRAFPVWALEKIDNALSAKIRGEGDEEVQSLTLINGKNEIENIELFIIRESIRENSDVIFSLDKDALLWLLERAEIPESCFFWIGVALMRLGEYDEAKEILSYDLFRGESSQEEIASLTHAEVVEHYESMISGELQEARELYKTEFIEIKLSNLFQDLEREREGNHLLNPSHIKSIFKLYDKQNELCDYARKIDKNYEDLLVESYGLLIEAGPSEMLKQQIMDLKDARKFMSEVSGFHSFSNNYLRHVKGSLAYGMFRQIFSGQRISSRADAVRGYPNLDKPFGIDVLSGDILENLETLFLVYDHFGCPKEFYNILRSTLDSELKYPPELCLESFDRNIIQTVLREYLDNEMAVIKDGERKDIGYKESSYGQILPPEFIARFYYAINEGNHFENLLKQWGGIVKKNLSKYHLQVYGGFRSVAGIIDEEIETKYFLYSLIKVVGKFKLSLFIHSLPTYKLLISGYSKLKDFRESRRNEVCTYSNDEVNAQIDKHLKYINLILSGFSDLEEPQQRHYYNDFVLALYDHNLLQLCFDLDSEELNIEESRQFSNYNVIDIRRVKNLDKPLIGDIKSKVSGFISRLDDSVIPLIEQESIKRLGYEYEISGNDHALNQATLDDYDEAYLQAKLLDLNVFIRGYNFNRGNNPLAKGRTPAAKAMCSVIADNRKDVFEKWEGIFKIGREADLHDTKNRSPETALFYSYFSRPIDDLFSVLDSSLDVQNYRSENPEIYFRDPVSIRADIMARAKGFLNSIDPELIFKMGDFYVECGRLLQNYVKTGSYQNLCMAFYTIFNQIPDFEHDFFQMESLSQNAWVVDGKAAESFIEIFIDTISYLTDSGFCEKTQIELLNSILNLVEMEIKASAAYDTAEQTKSDGNFFWS